MAQHALITGPISGRIPIDHDLYPNGFVDVTPEVVMFDSQDEALAVAEAIEAEHVVRGTHPIQQELAYLNDATAHPNGVDPERLAAVEQAHAELLDRMAPLDAAVASAVVENVAKDGAL